MASPFVWLPGTGTLSSGLENDGADGVRFKDASSTHWGKLVAYWKFNESSYPGTVGDISDSFGSDDARSFGSPSSVSGKLNNAISLNGSNQYGVIPSASISGSWPTGAQARAVSCWVNQSVVSAALRCILGYGTAAATQEFSLGLNNGDVWVARSSGNIVVTNTQPMANISQWYFLVLNFDGTNMTAFVDGVSINTVDASFLNTQISGDAQIGKRAFGGSYLAGLLDDLAFYNDTLTQDEIDWLYNSGTGREVPFYSVVAQTAEQTVASTDSDLVLFTSFQETKSGTGTTGWDYSTDGGTTFQGSYVSASTLNANAGSIDPTNQQINLKLQMQGDGISQLTVSQAQTGYSINTAPTVSAGVDKPVSGTILQTDTFEPFSDCTISDPDSSPGQLVSAEYMHEDDAGWTNIPIGAFASFQDAAQGLSLAAENYNTGANTFMLRATDNLGEVSSDSCIVTITASEPTPVTEYVEVSFDISGADLSFDISSVDLSFDLEAEEV